MILATGGTGQVGKELAKLGVTVLDRHGLDLSQPDSFAAALDHHRPDAIINAAAYTAVDKAEEDRDMAWAINATGPTRLAQEAEKRAIPLVHISTDYVFPGAGSTPYKPDDPVAPINAYGASKLDGEIGVLNHGGTVLRTSWVFSAHGNNFVKTMLRLSESRDTLSIVADQIGGPTSARAIAAACLTIAKAPKPGLYHFSGAPDASWADFARAIFDNAGRSVAVTDIPTADFPTPAARPANSRLDCATTQEDFGISRPDWASDLDLVVNELKETT